MSKVLFCAMPRRGKMVTCYEAAIAHHFPTLDGSFTKIVRGLVESSLLTHGFNRMWCGALNLREAEGVTHFGMIHDDVACSPGWADILLKEMEKYDADVMSAVIPIKDDRGVTSTGIDGQDPWAPRRLTLKEIYEKEETFTEENLIVNTGLWICRLDRPWCEKVLFRQSDQLVRTPEGKFIARTAPEDWDFSRQVRFLDGKIYATRKVHLHHECSQFHNKGVWGRWETDEGDRAQIPVTRNGSPVILH